MGSGVDLVITTHRGVGGDLNDCNNTTKPALIFTNFYEQSDDGPELHVQWESHRLRN